MIKEKKIAILGLGYVGLPLAVGLSSSYKIIGFDISLERISQLMNGIDKTREIKKVDLLRSLNNNLTLTSNNLMAVAHVSRLKAHLKVLKGY